MTPIKRSSADKNRVRAVSSDDSVTASAKTQQTLFPPASKADLVKQKQEAKVQQQAQHTAVISLTVKNTNKILKEIGFRRARLRVSIVFPREIFV